MSDHDRGAYAPQTDAPLSFDPRQQRGGGGGGPAPLTLLLSVLVLIGLGGGVFYFYRHGARHPGQSPQVVGAPVGPTKTAPGAGAGGDNDQAAGLQVYKTEATPPSEARGAPTLEAPPEQPAPLPPARPVQPPPPVIAQQPLRGVAPPPVTTTRVAPVAHAALPPVPHPPVELRPLKPAADVVAASGDTSSIAGSAFAPHAPPPAHVALPAHAPSSAKPTAPAKPTVLASQTAPVPPPLAKAKPKPVVSKPAMPAPADEIATTNAKVAATPKAAGGPVTVQIGAFSSSALAQQGFADDAHALPGPLAGKSHRVEAGDKDGKPIYRTFVGGFATRADAAAFCEALRAKNKPCFVK